MKKSGLNIRVPAFRRLIKNRASLFSLSLVILFAATLVGQNFIRKPEVALAITPPDTCFAFTSSTGTIEGYYDYEGNNSANPACPKDVDIPSEIGGVVVVNIGSRAFQGDWLNSVTIPDSVTTIGGFSFDSNNLTSVTIPSSVTDLGLYSFRGNYKLTSVVILNPDTITYHNTFGSGDSPIESMTIGTNTYVAQSPTTSNACFAISGTTISDYYAYSPVIAKSSGVLCSSDLVIPNNTTNIADNAFQANRIKSVVIPDSVVTIGNSSFSGNRLTSIIIPEGVSSLGTSAFSGNSLVSVTIPSSVTSIGANAFQYQNSVNIKTDGKTIENPVTVNGSYIGSEVGIYSNVYSIVTPFTDTISLTHYNASANFSYSITYGQGLTTLFSGGFSINSTDDFVLPNILGVNPTSINLNTIFDPRLGVTATDNIDGDVTNKIVISGDAVNTSVPGTYTVTYSVTDTSANTRTVNRTVTVLPDTTAPTINMSSIYGYTTRGLEFDELDGVTAIDNIDGSLTLTMANVSMDINKNTPVGTYTLVYTVKDKAGNTATRNRTVYVNRDYNYPIINLPSTNDSIKRGTDFDELAGVTATDNIDGSIPLTMNDVSMDINANTPVGYYTLTYSVSDSSNNIGRAYRYVQVYDNPPVITFVNDGSDYQVNINKGDTFDFKAQIKSVVDDIDGTMNIDDVTIVSNPEFDPNIYGQYQIEYSISDSGGNRSYAYGYVSVVGFEYATTITNDSLPVLEGVAGGVDFRQLAAYIIPSGQPFDPTDPGSEKPRYLVQLDRYGAFYIVTDQQEARLLVSEGMIQIRLNEIANIIKSDIIPEATFSENPTIDEIEGYCSDTRLQQAVGAMDEAGCSNGLQQMYDQDIVASAEQAAIDFDANASNYNWSSLPDGKYDIYFFELRLNSGATYLDGLIIDTTKPIASVAVPSGPTAETKSPAITGTVDDPKAVVVVTVNGKSYTAKNNGDGTWILAAGMIDTLGVGDYEVLVTITDEAGNVVTSTTQLTVNEIKETSPDNLAPTGVDMWMIVAGAGAVVAIGIGLLVYSRKSRK